MPRSALHVALYEGRKLAPKATTAAPATSPASPTAVVVSLPAPVGDRQLSALWDEVRLLARERDALRLTLGLARVHAEEMAERLRGYEDETILEDDDGED